VCKKGNDSSVLRGTVFILVIVPVLVLVPAWPATSQALDDAAAWRGRAIRAADYILRCQLPNGAIRDADDNPAVT
jgi:hypothetical protein